MLPDTRAMEPPFVMPSMIWSDGHLAHALQNTDDDEIRSTANRTERKVAVGHVPKRVPPALRDVPRAFAAPGWVRVCLA